MKCDLPRREIDGRFPDNRPRINDLVRGVAGLAVRACRWRSPPEL
jgi:hypothetical protein